MRTPPVVLLVALLALPQAAAEGEALSVKLSVAPPVASLEPGEAYFYHFTIEYACGPTRTIDLQVVYPPWSDAAVEDFQTRADQCLAPHRGRHTADVVLAVGTDAPEGAVGALTLVAKDWNATASATTDVKVRRVRPVVEVEEPTYVLGVNAGRPRDLALTATYTLWEPGRIRWFADAPQGWHVAVPAAHPVNTGEDVAITESFVVTPPADASGRVTVGLRAVLTTNDGTRVAESEPVELVFEATPPPPPAEDPEEDVAPAGDGSGTPDGPGTPRAPLWVLGAALVALVAGVYVLEAREERRGGREAQDGSRARDAEEEP